MSERRKNNREERMQWHFERTLEQRTGEVKGRLTWNAVRRWRHSFTTDSNLTAHLLLPPSDSSIEKVRSRRDWTPNEPAMTLRTSGLFALFLIDHKGWKNISEGQGSSIPLLSCLANLSTTSSGRSLSLSPSPFIVRQRRESRPVPWENGSFIGPSFPKRELSVESVRVMHNALTTRFSIIPISYNDRVERRAVRWSGSFALWFSEFRAGSRHHQKPRKPFEEDVTLLKFIFSSNAKSISLPVQSFHAFSSIDRRYSQSKLLLRSKHPEGPSKLRRRLLKSICLSSTFHVSIPITGMDSEVGGVIADTIPKNTVTERRFVISELKNCALSVKT